MQKKNCWIKRMIVQYDNHWWLSKQRCTETRGLHLCGMNWHGRIARFISRFPSWVLRLGAKITLRSVTLVEIIWGFKPEASCKDWNSYKCTNLPFSHLRDPIMPTGACCLKLISMLRILTPCVPTHSMSDLGQAVAFKIANLANWSITDLFLSIDRPRGRLTAIMLVAKSEFVPVGSVSMLWKMAITRRAIHGGASSSSATRAYQGGSGVCFSSFPKKAVVQIS